jgi:hypothetical protein
MRARGLWARPSGAAPLTRLHYQRDQCTLRDVGLPPHGSHPDGDRRVSRTSLATRVRPCGVGLLCARGSGARPQYDITRWPSSTPSGRPPPPGRG